MAAQIRRSDALRDLVMSTPPRQLLARLATYPQGQPLLADLHDYLQTYGHQIYNLDFVTPTQIDDPLPVLLSLKTAIQQPQRDARARQREMAQTRETLARQIERSLNPLLRPIFRRLLRWAQQNAPYRDKALFYVGAAWPTLRRLALELGRRLTASGSLQSPADVFFLRTAELEAAIGARADGDSGTVTLLDEVQTDPSPASTAGGTRGPNKTLLALAAGAIAGLLFWWRRRQMKREG